MPLHTGKKLRRQARPGSHSGSDLSTRQWTSFWRDLISRGSQKSPLLTGAAGRLRDLLMVQGRGLTDDDYFSYCVRQGTTVPVDRTTARPEDPRPERLQYDHKSSDIRALHTAWEDKLRDLEHKFDIIFTTQSCGSEDRQVTLSEVCEDGNLADRVYTVQSAYMAAKNKVMTSDSNAGSLDELCNTVAGVLRTTTNRFTKEEQAVKLYRQVVTDADEDPSQLNFSRLACDPTYVQRLLEITAEVMTSNLDRMNKERSRRLGDDALPYHNPKVPGHSRNDTPRGPDRGHNRHAPGHTTVNGHGFPPDRNAQHPSALDSQFGASQSRSAPAPTHQPLSQQSQLQTGRSPANTVSEPSWMSRPPTDRSSAHRSAAFDKFAQTKRNWGRLFWAGASVAALAATIEYTDVGQSVQQSPTTCSFIGLQRNRDVLGVPAQDAQALGSERGGKRSECDWAGGRGARKRGKGAAGCGSE